MGLLAMCTHPPLCTQDTRTEIAGKAILDLQTLEGCDTITSDLRLRKVFMKVQEVDKLVEEKLVELDAVVFATQVTLDMA